MKLEILTPEKRLFSGDVAYVTLPGTLGPFTVLANHAPIISSLNRGGKITFVQEGKEESIEIGSGFAEVLNNHIIVCVDEHIQVHE